MIYDLPKHTKRVGILPRLAELFLDCSHSGLRILELLKRQSTSKEAAMLLSAPNWLHR